MKRLNSREKQFTFPHIYIILLSIILLSSLLSYVIPAGEYERVEFEGREVVEPSSYHTVEPNRITLMSFLEAVPKGLVDTAGIIFFIFIVGGSFSVLEKTGSLTVALNKLAVLARGRGIISIPIIMLFFGFAGAVIGLAEETLPFIPIMTSLMMSLGFDSLTGAIVVLCGAGAGFSSAFMNPFTIGIAQGIVGLPMFSGLPFRIIMFLSFETLTITMTCFYASRVRKTPTLSLMFNEDETRETVKLDSSDETFTARKKLVLIVFLASLIVLVIGVVKFKWYMTEISALFFGMSMLVAVTSGMSFNEYALTLEKGMAEITSGALIVGFAKGVPIILNDAHIMDTILHAGATLLTKLPKEITSLGMYFVQCVLNFLLPSGGGQAAVSMPIMAPLGDMVGVTRQVSVTAFQLGDGISNVFFPTSGYFMAALAVGHIPYHKWAKTVFPLILAQYLLGAVFVIVANAIHLGPF